jgi:hypothetical protein
MKLQKINFWSTELILWLYADFSLQSLTQVQYQMTLCEERETSILSVSQKWQEDSLSVTEVTKLNQI